MRIRLHSLALVLVLGALALAGCGSSSKSSSSGGPRGTELSYFAKDTPFVLLAQTDPQSAPIKNALALIGRVPGSGLLLSALKQRVNATGLDYDQDIKPLEGNEVALSTPSPAAFTGSGSRFVIVWVTKSASKLDALIKKTHATANGTRDGAKLYDAGGASAAVDGATLVFSSSRADLVTALDHHSKGDGLDSATVDKAFSGLPAQPLARAYGAIQPLLSSPKAAKARNVPFVAALRSYALELTPSSDGVSLDVRLDTSGGSLSDAQLPLAPGATAPGVASALAIGAGLENPAHSAAFIESAMQAASPKSYASFQKQVLSIERRTKVSVQHDLIDKLTGGAQIASDAKSAFLARAQLSDPATFKTALDKVAPLLGDPTTKISRGPGGFWLISHTGKKGHSGTGAIGVVGNYVVAGKAPVAQLRAFASAATVPVSGANGALAFRVAVPQLLASVLHQKLGGAAGLVTGLLGELRGWANETSGALVAHADLAVR